MRRASNTCESSTRRCTIGPRVVEATSSDMRNHYAWDAPQKIKKQENKKRIYKFKSRFRDDGFIILVEKPNKQGKVNPQHILNTTPSLNSCTLNCPRQSIGKVVFSIHVHVGISLH